MAPPTIYVCVWLEYVCLCEDTFSCRSRHNTEQRGVGTLQRDNNVLPWLRSIDFLFSFWENSISVCVCVTPLGVLLVLERKIRCCGCPFFGGEISLETIIKR